MEIRKIIGWLLMYGYMFATIFQVTWFVLSFIYAVRNQDIVCTDRPHDGSSDVLQQHQTCTDCVDRQTQQSVGPKGHRSHYHFQHQPPANLVGNGSQDNFDKPKEKLDMSGNSGFWKYPRQFFMVNNHFRNTDAFLCSVFACHFHSPLVPPFSNTSESFHNSKSENFTFIDLKKTISTRAQSRAKVHIFNLPLDEDKCSAYENFNDSYGRNQCETDDMYVFTFKVRPNFILSIDCLGKSSNQSLSFENITEECFPGKRGIAIFNVTELKRDQQDNHLEFSKMKENRERQSLRSQVELASKTNRGIRHFNEVEFQQPFQSHLEQLKSAAVNNGSDFKPIDQSNETSSGAEHSILMVIRRILLNRMTNDDDVNNDQVGSEDADDERNTSDAKWIKLKDDADDKCSQEFFYPTVAVYIEGLTILFTAICAYLCYKHFFRPNYSNHSFLVACMLCAVISASLSLATWPHKSVRSFSHHWYFWVDIGCVLYIPMTVAIVIAYQWCTCPRATHDDDSDINSSPNTSRSDEPIGRQVPDLPFHLLNYGMSPPRPTSGERPSSRVRSPSLTSLRSGDGQNTGLGDHQPTRVSSAPISAIAVPGADDSSTHLLGGAGAVSATVYGSTNQVVNGIGHQPQSDSPTTTESPINLMFYSNPSLASSLDEECNGYMSGNEAHAAEDGRPRSDEYFETSPNEGTPLVPKSPSSRSL